jgi:ABC-type lipoprotein release transport system permease subunit
LDEQAFVPLSEVQWLTDMPAVLLGIVASVPGALLPALRASSIQPVLAMRARR